MRYDLGLIAELCGEVGLKCEVRSPNEAAIELEGGVALLFQNAEREEDCLMGFAESSWHTHGALMCSDLHGFNIELDYLDVVAGLADGTVLICELWVRGELSDRWLVHRDYVNEFGYLQDGDEIRIRPVSSKTKKSPSP
jgi:hypothetical protein